MSYLALKAARFGKTGYLIGDEIPEADVDPKMVKRLEGMGIIKEMPALQGASGVSAVDVMITVAKNIKPEAYTEDSYKVLADAVADTIKVASAKKSTPAQIEAQLAVINDAIKALVPANVAMPADTPPNPPADSSTIGATNDNKAG